MFTDIKNTATNADDCVYYPLVSTPFGRIPVIGATMTDEREREIARKYSSRDNRRAV